MGKGGARRLQLRNSKGRRARSKDGPLALVYPANDGMNGLCNSWRSGRRRGRGAWPGICGNLMKHVLLMSRQALQQQYQQQQQQRVRRGAR